MNELRKEALKSINPLYGLVLAGGRSHRMGEDKSKINWHGKEQQYYLYDLLDKFCEQTFISCRKGQVKSIDKKYATLPDTYEDLGQYGALLSALSKYEDASFIVVACDLPFVDEKTLKQLVNERDVSMIATAFSNPENGLPEPLIAIWERSGKKVLLNLLDEGITCPRKVLIKSSQMVKLIKILNPEIVMNVNTPVEAEKARCLFSERKIL